MAEASASSSSSSSSGTSHKVDMTPFLDDNKTREETVVQLADLSEDSHLEVALGLPRETRKDRFFRKLSTGHPCTSSIPLRIVNYVRGPRPKVDLPGLFSKAFPNDGTRSHQITTDPVPFLDIDRYILGRHIKLLLESTILRLTRILTNPWLFLILGAAYIISFAFFSRAQSFLTPTSSYITCDSAYWLSNNGCGLDGESCGPFTNSTFDFRCPAQCDSLILQNPRTVGGEQVVFVPLVVGGGDAQHTYRGDSFICAAANQQGLTTNGRGGCASLELVGNFTDFLPTTGNRLTSIGFPTVFPLSFRLSKTHSLSHCEDNRDAALAFNIIITWILFVVLRPRAIVLYWCLVCIGFWHITLFSQPRASPPVLSDGFGAFLPTLFIAYAFWRLAFRFTMPAFSKAPLEASVWYLVPFWVGVLNNITFDKIPISRLTASDLTKRSGAITALVIIIIIVFFLALNQVRVMRKTGWLPHYLKWYIIGGLVVLVVSQLPGLELRVHHYIISMALIPGTAFPTRMSAILQAFLLGMFLNGAAAFGFDSILQTAAELQEDGPSDSLLPTFLTNSTNYNYSIPLVNQTIFWGALPSSWDGFSLLVDDVERYAGAALNFSLAAFDPAIPHFFRLAFTSGDGTGDFTMPATLWPNGTWSGSMDEWFCNVCTPPSKNVKYMTLKVAQHHERHSTEHARNVIEFERQQWMLCEPDTAAWDAPGKGEPVLTKEEIKMRESQIHVDLVRDMVPFWIRGMEAAERGEVLRLEDFLATLETTSSWGESWGESGGDDGWGIGWSEVAHEKKGKKARRRKGHSKAYKFVEDVARQEAADEERKRRMHRFFEDLSALLIASSLPPLPHILQSFSPLPQVTTRTTSLVSVPHASFALRFSDLADIEAACAEAEEERAVRTIDWIGARINKRCAKWTEDLAKFNDKDSHRTPWWDELRRCTEGDHVPSKTEGWNHPVALILAVSTIAPNPLQAVAALHSRALELPPWVDTNILRYTLIIHPEDSPLSNEEAGALFNAVKKQYGLHSYLLSLSLPTPPPPSVLVPALIPRLPPPSSQESRNPPPTISQTPLNPSVPADPSGPHTIRLTETDIQQTARFTREFLVMSLLPWMENISSSTSSLPSKAAMNASAQVGSSISPLPQQRRLAEFATILGDLKLAVTVWEALRKDGKGGSDMLPMLLSPSPALPLHAANALSGMQLQVSDPRPHEQLVALKYAVRWEAGISASDFLNYPVEGERWLVWAAGNSEEPPAALLLAHAALLSSRKHAKRRAALWYLAAANRLEKCGISV
ncbi:hypothetical protein C0995_011872 [Termitomyces sp. Mi166|nr:hypothetical protein C0995_011872 [Termitomyces sp. Mi166\